MSLIEKILSRPEFQDRPPVLADIGASESIHKKWLRIAKYSICLSFDADDRELGYLVHESKTFRKQYVYNRIVSDKKSESQVFYLTKSPYCSSSLAPDNERLNDYAFAELFEVEKEVTMKTVDLPSVIAEVKLPKIDWFKTDTQGTDLRLFKSIGEEMIQKVLVAEFEPGLIDAYKGEDKLHAVLSYMEKSDFWLADMKVLGSQRISRKTKAAKLGSVSDRFMKIILRTSPGWAELVYFNSFRREERFDKRDFMLGWVFATIQEQHGFALDLSIHGKDKFGDAVFSEMEKHTMRKIRLRMFRIPFFYARIIIGRILS